MPDPTLIALLELLTRTQLNKREGQLVAAIALETLGRDQPDAELPSTHLAKTTSIDARHVRQTLQRLEHRELIRRNGGTRGRPARIRLVLPEPETPQEAPTQAHHDVNGSTTPPNGNHEAFARSHARVYKMPTKPGSVDEAFEVLHRLGALPRDPAA